jgi:hypothetical protein
MDGDAIKTYLDSPNQGFRKTLNLKLSGVYVPNTPTNREKILPFDEKLSNSGNDKIIKIDNVIKKDTEVFNKELIIEIEKEKDNDEIHLEFKKEESDLINRFELNLNESQFKDIQSSVNNSIKQTSKDNSNCRISNIEESIIEFFVVNNNEEKNDQNLINDSQLMENQEYSTENNLVKNDNFVKNNEESAFNNLEENFNHTTTDKNINLNINIGDKYLENILSIDHKEKIVIIKTEEDIKESKNTKEDLEDEKEENKNNNQPSVNQNKFSNCDI